MYSSVFYVLPMSVDCAVDLNNIHVIECQGEL
jgi:hypothetical protein